MSLLTPPMWTLPSGAAFIREHAETAREHGFNLHLGGGVLDRGWSDSDLDVVALPRFQSPLQRRVEFVAAVTASGWEGLPEREAWLPRRHVIVLREEFRWWRSLRGPGFPRIVELIFFE